MNPSSFKHTRLKGLSIKQTDVMAATWSSTLDKTSKKYGCLSVITCFTQAVSSRAMASAQCASMNLKHFVSNWIKRRSMLFLNKWLLFMQSPFCRPKSNLWQSKELSVVKSNKWLKTAQICKDNQKSNWTHLQITMSLRSTDLSWSPSCNKARSLLRARAELLSPKRKGTTRWWLCSKRLSPKKS